MSKKFSSALVLLVLVCLLGGSLLPVASGQAGTSRAAQNATLITTADAILKETSELRQLAVLREVKSGAQSRSEIEKVIIKNLDAETTPAEMYAAEALLKAFGLAPPDFAYRTFIIKLLSEQVAGYYDPKAKRFYLADWIELEGQKPVMAHELTHALQDQHFNLRRFEKWPKGDSDAELAARALIEGDATLAMAHYLFKHPLIALAFIRSAQDTPSEEFEKAPRALRESLLFPYTQGSEWATKVHERGGWAMISNAFTKLPKSTEQILHPEKYFSYEAPVRVTLPSFTRALGPGWRPIDNDVSGEWGYYLVLDEFLNDARTSKQAAAGWCGDRFAIYEGPRKSGMFLAQMTVWDTAADADEFFDAYSKRTTKRLRDASALRPGTAEAGARRTEWKTPAGGGVIELRGSRVVILEGIPAKANANQLLEMIWQQPRRPKTRKS